MRYTTVVGNPTDTIYPENLFDITVPYGTSMHRHQSSSRHTVRYVNVFSDQSRHHSSRALPEPLHPSTHTRRPGIRMELVAHASHTLHNPSAPP